MRLRSCCRPSRISFSVLIALTGSPLSGADAQVRREFSEVHMGVPVRIVLYATDSVHAATAARAAFLRIAVLEDSLSDYRPASALREIEARAGEWVRTGDAVFAVIARAIDIARRTDGAFDPTVGALVALWRQARRDGRLPDPNELEAALRFTGYHLVMLDSTRQAVRLARPGARLDLGGIAKGYILQKALEVLRAEGTRSALIEAGGDIVVGDAPPGRAGWRIDAPFGSNDVRARAHALSNAALATSGPTEQFLVVDGVRYSHVVDPRTGRALNNDYAATVIAPDAATADALATALTVTGPDALAGLPSAFPEALASVRLVPRVSGLVMDDNDIEFVEVYQW